MGMNRREIIKWGLLGLSSAAMGCLGGDSSSQKQLSASVPLRTPPAQLVAQASTKAVGKVVLGDWSPKERDQAFSQLLSDAPENGSEFAKYLRNKHDKDLTKGRVQRVDGWLLSKTEATFYAYVANA